MKIDIPMPSYSESMEEADLIGWLVAPGDFVHEGDPIAEIETDKATGELESPASGTIVEICVPEGTTGVGVGRVVARLEPPQGEPAQPAPGVPDPVEETAPAADLASDPSPAAAPSPAPAPQATGEPLCDEAPRASVATPPVTALARRLAERTGIDLGQLKGTGTRGRITKADVEAAATGVSATAPTSSSLAVLDVECRIDHALDVCRQLSAREPDLEIGLLALVVRAAGQALRAVPGVCSGVADEASAFDIRVQSAQTEAQTLCDADRKSLSVLSRELALDPAPQGPSPALQITDLSPQGIHRVQFVPAAGIPLALGMGAPRGAAMDAGAMTATFTLCADTAAVEMGLASRWLFEFRRRLEEPLEMLL